MKLIPEMQDVGGSIDLSKIVVKITSDWTDGGQLISIWFDQWSYDNSMGRHTEAWVPSWWTLA
jgi:hypothetical protein